MKLPENVMHSVMLERQLLSKHIDEKSVYLIRFAIADAYCKFEPGDVVFICPKNNPDWVTRILQYVRLTGDELVVEKDSNQQLPLREILSSHYELILRPSVLSELGLKDSVDFWPTLVHLYEKAGSDFNIDTLLSWLKPMRPRAYSIASCQAAKPGVLELIVGLVTFRDINGGICEGLSSGFLCKRLQEGDSVTIYVKSTRFKLPQEPKSPVIMVGPGTGIAPFKAFLEARALEASNGGNWLFFGGRHRDNDFLLENQLAEYQKDGVLTYLDVAFSRDQDHKVYVQHKMVEKADVLWSWLQRGAYFYICGDAKLMAKDVESTLINIIAEQGHFDMEGAQAYLKALKQQGRYQKDVY